MKAHKSPLLLLNFSLLNHQYRFISPDNDDVEMIDIIGKYEIDIDFAFKHGENDDIIQLFTKISVNDIDDALPGYALFVEGVCYFSFAADAEIDEKAKSQLLHVSGLNININNLRNILAATTANAPYGKYLLPSIDLSKLMADKKEQAKNKDEGSLIQ